MGKKPREKQTAKSSSISVRNQIPVSYSDVTNYFERMGTINPSELRMQTLQCIEELTSRPIICYVSKTLGSPLYLFPSLTPLAAERIVKMLRQKFKHIRFIIPSNAFSAATMICFSGDEIIMNATSSTLGPIDPQLEGIPIRAVLRGLEEIERRVKEEGTII